MPQVALHVGVDPSLLYTRHKLLELAGYNVVSCPSTELALREFEAGDFDFVVLCHSLPKPEREKLARFIHTWSPSTAIVLVLIMHETDSSMDVIIDSEPVQFVRELPLVLNRLLPPEDMSPHLQPAPARHAEVNKRSPFSGTATVKPIRP